MKLLLQLATAALFLEAKQSQPVVAAGPPPSMSSMPTNPVTKVVKLLEKMSVDLAAEQKKDEEVYQKFSCWCEVTIKEKTEALEQAATRRSELESAIEDGTAAKARLETELEQLKDERAANEEAIKTATELRAKEKAQFEADTAEMRATVDSITQALAALKKGTGLSAPEAGEEEAAEALLQVKAKLALRSKELPQAVLSWLQSAHSQPAGFKSYNSRSGQIVGILAQMKDDFNNDIKEAVAAEEKAQASFDKLVAAKKAEIKAQNEAVLEKTNQKTETEVALVQAKHDLKDLIATAEADEKVLADANDKCPKFDAEFAERKKQRQEEIDAISEALTILTEDAARDIFGSTFSFAQLSLTQRVTMARTQASEVLRQAALKAGATPRSAALMQLAAQTKIGGLDKVKAYIDDMIAQLTKEQQAEVEHQQWCTDELDKNEDEVRSKTWKQEDLTKKVNDLGEQLETLDDELAQLEKQIAENLREIKRAGEDREAANAEFEAAVANQRGAVAILTKVLERLQATYAPDVLKAKKEKQRIEAENAAAAERNKMTPGAAKAGIKVANDQQVVPEVALVQQPEGFGEYKKQSSGGVLGLIEQCIGDAERLVDEAIHAEQEQQSAYEQLVTDTGAALTADRKSVADKTKERATAALAKDEAEKDLQATGQVLQDLAKYASSVHSACDFVLDNFGLRQEARAAEIDSLKQAHAILSGADFGA